LSNPAFIPNTSLYSIPPKRTKPDLKDRKRDIRPAGFQYSENKKIDEAGSSDEQVIEGVDVPDVSIRSKDEAKKTGKYPNEFMHLPDGSRIAYTQIYQEGSNEIVIYLPNLADGRISSSSAEIEEFCSNNGYHFLCADWYSRGDSSGKLADATLTRWTDDIINLLDRCAPDVKGGMGGTKAIFVGAGVGVWVAVLVALKRPDLARGLVGIGGDPDFTEDLLWKELPEETKEEIMTKGFKEITWGRFNAVYPVTSGLIEDGRKNLVLRGGPKSLPITCPVRLIHCINDEEVPVETSMKLAECMQSQNCVISMPKDGLNSKAINRAIEQCIEFTQDYDVN